MASLTIARPRTVSERLYLGDLAHLFDRQRTRNGVQLTLDSFAADLAAQDSLRSGLFTLCTAISHMGEDDLSPEELLDLVARAVDPSADNAVPVPDAMRAAFLSGYESWRARDLQQMADLSEPEPWPPEPPAARKPPQREGAAESVSQREAAAVGAESCSPPTPPIASHTRKTVQEAISLVRRDVRNAERHDLPSEFDPAGDATVGSMTLGEIKHILEEIEERVIRLGPHLQHLGAAARQPGRSHVSRSSDAVIPFLLARDASEEEGGPADAFDLDTLVRRRLNPAGATDTSLTSALAAYDRPPGIDALVAAAPAWASATPTARSFSEDGFLARHGYLAPARRPSASAPAAAHHVETATIPLAQPVLHASPPAAPLHVSVEPAHIERAFVEDDEPLLSPPQRLQLALLRLSPRKVFLTLAALTVFAGGLAGFIAYRSLHTHRVLHFSDLERPARFGAPAATVTVAPTPAPPSPVALQNPPAAALPAPHRSAARPIARNRPPALPASLRGTAPSPNPAEVEVWPSEPASNQPSATQTAAPLPGASAPGPQQSAPTGPVYVPAPTMIGYTLAAPQPVYPGQHALGISGTVTVALTISRLGDVISAEAVSGPPELRAAAVSAVRGWRFRPYILDGIPVPVTTNLQFYFKGN